MSTDVVATIDRLRATFDSGRTTDLGWRKRQLQGVIDLVRENEEQLADALTADLGKPAFDSWLTELNLVKDEAAHALKHLGSWVKPTKHSVPLVVQPAKAWTEPQPLGVVLIIAPWNYPLQLLLAPAVAALAAGNAMVLKPSELAPATSAAVAELVPRYLDAEAVAVVEGGVPETTALLEQAWDHILYTSSTRVGRVVMEAAAKHLTPVTLELGGKSPTIIAADADLKVAAKRVAWAKILNAGQTCIAPDYVLVSEDKKIALIDAIHDTVKSFYGQTPIEWRNSPDLCRIVNRRHFDRIKGLLDDAKKHGAQVAFGGDTDEHDNYISPTVITDIGDASKILEEEIFGPLLPVITYRHLDEALEYIRRGEKPLALYVFSSSENAIENVIRNTAAGGTSVNDCLMQFVNPKLPFGGSNNSGLGRYHGHHGFKAFSHERAVFKQSRLFNPMQIFYPPYGGQFRETFQKFIRHIM